MSIKDKFQIAIELIATSSFIIGLPLLVVASVAKSFNFF